MSGRFIAHVRLSWSSHLNRRAFGSAGSVFIWTGFSLRSARWSRSAPALMGGRPKRKAVVAKPRGTSRPQNAHLALFRWRRAFIWTGFSLRSARWSRSAPALMGGRPKRKAVVAKPRGTSRPQNAHLALFRWRRAFIWTGFSLRSARWSRSAPALMGGRPKRKAVVAKPRGTSRPQNAHLCTISSASRLAPGDPAP